VSGFYIHIQYVEYGPTVIDATAFPNKTKRLNLIKRDSLERDISDIILISLVEIFLNYQLNR